ncbi:Gfo/Idh/MocA family protein [Treponema maltophilum]|uniref:Gfo/Idh/MocA family protein n=1 Tax=Treponema maltophilum TaxID=51160 RepID=UPI003D943018
MVRIVIIGAGFMGQTHARCYRNIPNAQLVGICDTNEQKAEPLCKELSCNYYNDFTRLLEEKDIDVIDICLPSFLHEEYVVKAAQKKKHIFCEKPAALSKESLSHMIQAVKDNKVRLAIGQVVRFWPEYVYAKNKYDKKLFGNIKHVYASRCSTHPEWGLWFKNKQTSGGGLYDLHSHDIDFLCSVFGPVKKVYAIGSKNSAGSWNYISTFLTFQNGIKACAEGIWEMPKNYPFSTTLRIVGDAGAFEHRMKAGVNLENINDAQRTSFWYDNSEQPQKLDIEPYDAYTKELTYFVDCVHKNRSFDQVDLDSIETVFSVLDAIEQSLETGKEICL